MAFKIEENFEVQAPIENVWEFLIDPRRVVVCLPGAEVTRTIDERSYEGRVSVKVGPVKAKYEGTVNLEEVNEAEHLVRLVGQGKETSGSGSAKMTMTGRVSESGRDTSQVEVDAEVDVAGKMARFGRGVMEDVSRQLFREFAANMQKTLAEPEEEPAVPESPKLEDDPGKSSSPGETASPTKEKTTRSAKKTTPTTKKTTRSAKKTTPSDGASSMDAPRPVSLVKLVSRALLERLKRLIRR